MNVQQRQCKACPWRKSTVPERDIPGGYCEKKHRGLESTIAEPASFAGFGESMHAMACHESTDGAELACAGWLLHQLNEGNNLALRMLALDGRFKNVRTVGPQHETFEDTLPKKRKKRT
jgi:hypothetical protein